MQALCAVSLLQLHKEEEKNEEVSEYTDNQGKREAGSSALEKRLLQPLVIVQ